jgi:hypothetical protein
LSTRLAALIAAAGKEAGMTHVGLVAARGDGRLPLVDWRALVAPARAAESFAVVDGDPADPGRLAEVAAGREAPELTLRGPGLLVRPTLDARQTKLRAVQCAITDPVSFALVDNRTKAEFPELAGWSAADWARRAVAEHQVWLRAAAPPSANGYEWIEQPPASNGTGLATRDRLLAAARAALFQESIDDGTPTLTLSLELVAERIGVDVENVPAVHKAVVGLRAYR